MTKLILKCALLMSLISIPAQAQVTGPLSSFAWNYVNTDLTTYQVTHFRSCIDDTCQDNQLSSVIWNADPNPVTGQTSYKITIGAQTVGSHTVTVAACNARGCGDSLSVPFTFELVPPTPVNGRFVPGLE